MADAYRLADDDGRSNNIVDPSRPNIIINNIPPKQPWFRSLLFKALLVMSVIANFALLGLYARYYPNVDSGEEFKEGDRLASDKIAVIKVRGMIMSETVAAPKRELKIAAEDAAVKAVVLHVDSPGGTISGSDELYVAIEEFKAKCKKPIVVSMHGMATSGAYYISMPADEIIAERSCITGSIGVISQMINFEKLMKHHGVTAEVVKSGTMKDSGSPYRSLTEPERAEWQKLIDGMYAQFLGVIMKYRADKIGGEAALRKAADGRVFLAEEAKKLGLIDGIGYFDDALAAAKKRANLGDKVRVVTYARPELFGNLLSLLGEPPNRHLGSTELRALAEVMSPRIMLVPSFWLTVP